ncbi:MAG: hypothetical protein M1820_009743 [Bogoriella megaspora]|nr:MAG: hypothetical protein M1820_009743 [Bogoriella megaspora]
MSAESPVRPSRRATARRKAIVDSDEEDEVHTTRDDDSEDFTPAPARSSRRKTTQGAPETPRTTRGRKVRVSESIASSVEPSQTFDPNETAISSTVPSPSKSPSKKAASPPKRRSVKNVRAARKSRVSITPDENSEMPPPAMPTPQPSASPEPRSKHSTPLGDISESRLNQQEATPIQSKLDANETPRLAVAEVENNDETVAKKVEKVDPKTTLLEKPMDIVVRTRNATIPKVQEPEVPKSRMVITYLVLINFKSYAGRQEVGPFHASFSSVVGPNGSGKSNVIDSLLFVFGFRASKMRQGKISALIHNSAAFPDLDHCEVEVHFQEVMDQPGGDSEVVPDSRLIISRRAFKNNASKYYINSKESTFTVVTTLLKDKGVDLDHKRFLILQGEVESIAQMKPKAANEHDDGLLEYLEDIIGTSKYKTPIEESAAETETLNEVCQEKNTRVQHVEKEKNALEDKKNKALEYVRDENELATKQSALYQLLAHECSDHIQVSQEAVANLQGQLNTELERHAGSEEEIKQLEKQYKNGNKEYEKLDKDTQAVLKEVAKLDKETVKFEEKKKFLAGKTKKLEKQMQSNKFATSEAQTQGKNATDDIERCSMQIAELEKEMKVEEQDLTTIRESLKGKTQGLSDQIAEKQRLLEPWNAKVNEKQSAIAVAQSELDILREKEHASANAIEEVQSKIVGFQDSKVAKTGELNECKSERKRLEKEAGTVQASLEEVAQKEPAVRSKLSNARQKADEARASLSAAQTQGNVLTGLMRLKDSGRINGFHGRLGNLGAIDQKYDVAISTACPALDNLVVDTVEIGQQCIDYLRKNNLGRANFILLDRLAKRDLSEIETPENAPRLFDLVKSKEERFRPAFYSVLQNTLVAKDLEQANRIAYGAQRWRVVTLDGQLIDKSGTMSGGGTRVAKGAMSSKLAADFTKDQVAKLENDRDAIEQTFQELQSEQRELEVKLKDLQDQIPKLETKAQKLTLELGSFDRNIADAERRIQELGAEQGVSKADKSRMVALEKSIAGTESEVEKLRAETTGIEEEIQALQDKIMEIGGVRLRAQKAKVDGLRSQIDSLTDEVSNAEVAKTKAEKQRVKSEKACEEAETELEKVKVEAEKVDEDMKNQSRDASGSRRQAEEAKEALETKKEELSALKTELDAKTSELNETRGVEIEMRNKLEESQKSLREYQKKVAHYEDKISKLSLQNISDTGEEKEPEAIPTYTADELSDLSKSHLQSEITALEQKTSNATIELSVLQEYRRRVEEHTSRAADLATAVSTRDAAKKRCDDLRRLRLEGFMEGFSTISLRLKEMYQMITMGGNAELELVDSLDPFSEGILFSVMPPKKSWKNIGNLSGGEKTLSSLALVFALHHYRPTPLYVMDEIDAALDFRNVSIVASYIKERTKNAQFIVISLRNNMFELAARLVGVYKVNHMTKSVTVENRDYITGRS